MRILLALSLTTFLICGSLSAQLNRTTTEKAPPLRSTDEFVKDQIIVRIDHGDAKTLDLVMTQVGSTGCKRLFRDDIWLLDLPFGSSVHEVIGFVEQISGVQYAHVNAIVQAVGIPNDPSFSSQWGFNQGNDADIDAPEGWDLQTDASSVVVAVIDTGVQWNHPDLQANMWTNPGEIPGNGQDDDANGYVDDVYGYDFDHGDGDPMDDNGHGTHCSGTIGAETNNGIGVAGVCWTAKIMALKFLDSSGSGSIADSILAVEYAMDNGAQLMSNSWGCYCSSGSVQGLRDAVDMAGDAGLLFVAAAGNSNSNNDNSAFYPATFDLPEVLSVASSTSNDSRSSFSNWGATTVDLAAPGSDILSTWTGSSYVTISGTSMACPHVAGSVTLVSSYCPTLSMMEVKQVIMDSVDVLPAFNGLVLTDGRLNLRSALESCAPPPPSADVTVLSPNGGELYYGSSTSLRWSWNDPQGLIDRVDLWLQDSLGQELSFIDGGEINDGLYEWDISGINDGGYRVRVEALNSSGIFLGEDNSNAAFRIDRSTFVTVLSPNGGEWLYGVRNITWTASDPDSEIDHVNLYLQDAGGEDIQLLSGSQPNDGVYAWDTSAILDGTYRVRVEARNGSDQVLGEDGSASFFTVDNSTTVQVLSPNGNELLIENTEITWSASNAHGALDHVDIYLQDGAGLDLFALAIGEPNDGSYSWDNSGLADGTYKIRVEALNSAGDTLGEDGSDSAFRVDHSALVTVLSPNGTGPYSGTEIEIQWSATDVDNEIGSVDIWLQNLDGSIDLVPIALGAINDGSYDWDITAVSRGAYRIKVEARNGGAQLLGRDSSDGPFVIGLSRPRNRGF